MLEKAVAVPCRCHLYATCESERRGASQPAGSAAVLRRVAGSLPAAELRGRVAPHLVYIKIYINNYYILSTKKKIM